MYVVQIFLPLQDNQGRPFPHAQFAAVHEQLADRFGGITAFTRSPAVGVWEDDAGTARHDDIVIFEVMTETVDAPWWRQYREGLERRFRQDEIVVRATAAERL